MRILLLLISLSCFSVSANFFLDGKTVYHIFDDKNGLVIVSNRDKIYLNKSCVARSQKFGQGYWGVKKENDKNIEVVFSKKKITLTPQMPVYQLPACKIPKSLLKKLLGL